MRLFSLLVAGSFTLLANAQNFSSYVPECATSCVEETLNSTKACASIDDNKCLCTNFPEILFPSIQCFMSTCNSSNTAALRSEITSGWQKFCNASGTPIVFPTGGWNPGGPESPVTSPTSAATSSSVASSTSPTSTSTSPAATAAAAATSSGLSTGAKAGIGVGAGVGSLAVIGGLVFLGFRLGKKRRENEAEDTALSNGGHPDDGQAHGTGSQMSGTPLDRGATGEEWVYKPELGAATPLSELHAHSVPPSEMPAHDIRELPVTEIPVELWHGVLPPELSADSEIPRDRIRGTPRL
ncbi:hypothetical protein F5Y10DRAFT_242698 [Nemania abortiva]|nr:hypothetical protein F5Y10DRAFT_242698 [Nemania abortiva]